MKGLENAIRNLNSLDTRMVPQASAWAINRVAQKAVSVATRQVAGNTVAGDNQVSGLQRIEYLAFVQQRTAKFDAEEGELPEAERQIAFLRMGMDINAWLVSRSLWNADQSKDVETLCASVITTWSYDALGAGAEMVLSLSGMGTIDNAGDDEHEVLTPEKS
ncbi:TPA: phage minor tail protein G [Escherichia coli]|nr:phage minor tail protein G [Escherichia coli]